MPESVVMWGGVGNFGVQLVLGPRHAMQYLTSWLWVYVMIMSYLFYPILLVDHLTR